MPEVWNYFPQGLSESLEFDTDIRMAPGGEWRDSLKDATQVFRVDHVMNPVKAEKLIYRVESNAFGDWYFPDWPNQTRTYSNIASASTVLAVDNSDAYIVGQKVFVATDEDHWEQAAVLSKAVGSITLTAGLASSYGGNAIRPAVVVPLVLCIAASGVDFQASFGSVVLSASFMSMEPLDLSNNSYPLFQTLPVVLDGAVSFSPMAGSMFQAIDVMASRFGAYEQQEAELFTRRRGTVSWLDKGYAAMWTRRQFVHFLRGRDGEFWLPTGQNDLRLQANIDAGDLSILVKGVMPDAQAVGKFIVIREGSNVAYKEIAAALTTGGVQELEIAATGIAFSQNAVVSVMVRSRLDNDTVELIYQFMAGALASTCVVATVEVP